MSFEYGRAGDLSSSGPNLRLPGLSCEPSGACIHWAWASLSGTEHQWIALLSPGGLGGRTGIGNPSLSSGTL